MTRTEKKSWNKSVCIRDMVAFQSRSNPSVVKVCFGPALSQLFAGQKPRSVCSGLSDPLFSRSSVCRSFVGVIFGGRCRHRRRPAKLHFRYALAECTVRQRESHHTVLDSVCISLIVIVAAIVVNPVTTLWCDYLLLYSESHSYWHTARRLPVRCRTLDSLSAKEFNINVTQRTHHVAKLSS